MPEPGKAAGTAAQSEGHSLAGSHAGEVDETEPSHRGEGRLGGQMVGRVIGRRLNRQLLRGRPQQDRRQLQVQLRGRSKRPAEQSLEEDAQRTVAL